MTVSMRTLRVVGEFDASKYAQGAAAKEAADKKMTTSAGALADAQSRLERVTDRSVAGNATWVRQLDRTIGGVDRGHKAALQFTNTHRNLTDAHERGRITAESYNRALDLAADRYRRAVQGASAYVSESGRLAAALNAANLALGRFGLGFGALGLGAGVGIFGGIAAGIGALVAASVKAVNEFQKFEEQSLALNAVLNSTGFSAGKTAADVEALATEIGNIGQVRDAATQLATFRSIAGDTFDRALKAADDLAAAGFGNLTSSALQLAKALEDPEQGLQALRRVGVSFSAAQRQVIKDLIDTGRAAEAQNKILEGVERQVGGAGAARDQGLAGSYEALSDATKRLLEGWGKQIVTGLNLTGVIRGIASAIDETTKRASDPQSQLGLIDRGIEEARRRVSEQNQMGLPGLARGSERTLNRLLEQRADLLRKIVKEQQAVDASMDTAAYGQLTAELEAQREKFEVVTRAIEKETEALRKNELQRAVEKELRNAGIAPGSAPAQQIERAVNIRMATEATEKAVDAIRAQADAHKIERATLGMSIAAATAYRNEMELLAREKAKGVTLSDSMAAAIRKEAQANGAAAQAAALAGLQNRTRVDRDTLFFTDTERQIAQEMKTIFGDEWQQNMDASIAGQMRLNAALSNRTEAPANDKPKAEIKRDRDQRENERVQHPLAAAA